MCDTCWALSHGGPGGAEGSSVASAQTGAYHAGTKAALSNAAALWQSKFGIEVLQPEAVRTKELHSPFGRHEAVTRNTRSVS